MNIETIRVIFPPSDKADVMPVESPVVVKAEISSKTSDIRSCRASVKVSTMVPMVTNTIEKSRMVIARKIVLSGICECSILTRCLPRTVLMAETKRMKKVVVLIPPPVEAGEAPINIRMISSSKVGLSTWPKSTELNPEVREAADWKNETTIFPPRECPWSE